MVANLTEFMQQLPISWLVNGPVGLAEQTANGTALDYQVSLVRQAARAGMPLVCPSDAIQHVGGDRKLIQGPHESDSKFRIRCQDAWGSWSRAGTAVELLTELYYGEFYGAVLVQQNGLSYSLSAAPTPGQDPTALLTRSMLGQNTGITSAPQHRVEVFIVVGGVLGVMEYQVSVDFSSVIPLGFSVAGDGLGYSVQIPGYEEITIFFEPGTYVGGSDYLFLTNGTLSTTGGAIDGVSLECSPWWTFDARDYFCSRFAVLFPGPTFPPSLTTFGTATFTGTSSASVTWNNEFPDTTYRYLCGPATFSGGGLVEVTPDSSTKSRTGITVNASAAFTGTADLIAWQSGSNPFADFHASDLSRLRTLISTWRPGNATCVGIYALAQGRFWGWPVETWGDGDTWGHSEVVSYTP